MNLFFAAKFDKQVSKIKSQKLINEIHQIIELAEKAHSISDLKNVKKLTGYKNHFRIRLGDYRIGLFLNETGLEFSAFDHRKDIYKYFP
jgi:mRNA interferase RelE/StbE